MNIALFRATLIHALVQAGAEVHVACPEDGYAPAIRELGATLHPWTPKRSASPVALLASTAALKRLVRDVKPNLAHSFTHLPNIAARLAVPRPIPLVQSVTGLGSILAGTGFKAALGRIGLRKLYALTKNRPDRLIFQNPDDLADFERLGLVGKSPAVLVRGSGVDLDRFDPARFSAEDRAAIRREWNIPENAFVVGMAARLTHDKGVRELLLAARALGEKHPRLVFVVAGAPDPGNPASLAQADVALLSKMPNVRFPGWVEDAPRFWSGVDLAVLPSHREGLPVSLQEALAMGLPVVTADAPGCRELAGEHSLLAPVGKWPILAGAIERVAVDAKLRKRMAWAARPAAQARFDATRLAGEVIAVYADC